MKRKIKTKNFHSMEVTKETYDRFCVDKEIYIIYNKFIQKYYILNNYI